MSETAVISGGLHQHGLELFRQGKFEEAAQTLADALKAEESGELWNDWATTQLMCNQAGRSEEGYRRALEIDPQCFRAAGNLGVLLGDSGRIAEAIPHLELAANHSHGKERDQLLKLAKTYRSHPSASSGKNQAPANTLSQMANTIYLQSQTIAQLAQRLSALEAKVTEANPIAPPKLAGSRAPRKSQFFSSSKGNTQAGSASQEPPRASGDGIRGPAAQGGTAVGREAFTSPPKPQSAHEVPQPGVFFNGIVYGGSGFAEEAWMVVLGLEDHHLEVRLAPAGESEDSRNLIPEPSRKRLESLQHHLLDIPHSVIFQNGPSPGWNGNRSGRCRVGRTMFETDTIPEIYRDGCNAVDEVWVPSRFNMETFAKAGVEERKLRLVPGAIDTQVFRPDAAPLDIPKRRGFNFLSVFDWHLRKGYDALLHAYLREFNPGEDVALILKVYQIVDGFTDLEAKISHFIERVAGIPLEKAPPIILMNGFIPQEDMARLYASADAFVLPSRGEGYGRTYLEALACRLPVIATRWSGQMDFLTDENSYLIESRLTPVLSDVEIEVYRGQNWAEPSVDHLRELMREVYTHPEKARRKAELGKNNIVRSYDWSAVIPQWVNEFRRLLS